MLHVNGVSLKTIAKKAIMKISPSQQTDVAERIARFWIRNGYTGEQACGWVAQADAESSFVITALGDRGNAFGLFQWHKDRAHNILVETGIDITKFPSVEDQCRAALHELNTSEKRARLQLLTTDTAYEAGYALARYYERPADKAQWDKRGKLAETWHSKLLPLVQSPGVGLSA